jgi:quinoprotein relay system zinc metallohydrolase 2
VLELLLEACLADRPDTCATRLVPQPAGCDVAAAEAWVAERPELVLRGARCAPLAEGLAPLAVAEVAPGVFVHEGAVALASAGNGGDIANLGFVVGERAVAVIDAGGSRAVGEALYAAVRARTALPIRWLVLTHMHPDHVRGAAVFAEAGAEVVGHARLGPALAARAASYAAMLERDLGPAGAMASALPAPDVGVADELVLDLGGRSLVVRSQPTAHTDNDLTVLDAATGTLFAGDLVFDRHLPTLDGSLLGWIELLDALAAEPAERAVPGHGAAALPWPAGAAPTKDYLAALAEATREAVAAGESLGEAAPRVGADLRDGWALFDVFNQRNATAAYHELEWE